MSAADWDTKLDNAELSPSIQSYDGAPFFYVATYPRGYLVPFQRRCLHCTHAYARPSVSPPGFHPYGKTYCKLGRFHSM